MNSKSTKIHQILLLIIGFFFASLAWGQAVYKSDAAITSSSDYIACAKEKNIALPKIGTGQALTEAQRNELYLCVRTAAHAACSDKVGVPVGKFASATADEKSKIQVCMAMKGFPGHLYQQQDTAENTAAH